MKALIIIPAYNEEKNILKSFNKIKKVSNLGKNVDIMVINDGSTDDTKNILEKNNIPHINLINNLGIGGAVQTGYKYAYENNYDIAIQFDGDGQHDANYIKNIIEPLKDNKADMVIGSRFIDSSSSDFKSTKTRRLGINIISFFIKFLTKKKIYDTTSGFRAINKDLIKLFANDYPVEYPEPVSTTKILKTGYKVLEIPVSMNERKHGISSINQWKNIYYMVNVIISIIVIGIGGTKK